MKGIESLKNTIIDLPDKVKFGLHVISIPLIIGTMGLLTDPLVPNTTPNYKMTVEVGESFEYSRSHDWRGKYFGQSTLIVFNDRYQYADSLRLQLGDCLSVDNGITNARIEDISSNSMVMAYPIGKEDCEHVHDLEKRLYANSH